MPNILTTGSATQAIDRAALEAHLDDYAASYIDAKGVKRLLIIPPDHTRLNSMAGEITAYLWDRLSDRIHIDILPALGTHVPMAEAQCERMFGSGVPFDRILPHRWRDDLRVLGELPAGYLSELSAGKLDQPMQVAVNRRLFEGDYDLILSIGQVVPHEVVGLANYTKNIMIGVGGKDTIDKSHFLGAVCGMESIMGRGDTPVRRALNTAFDRYVRDVLAVHFILTVIGPDERHNNVLRGLYIGDDDTAFEAAGALSRQVNFDVLDEPIDRCVVYLDAEEFHTTWLGNKAIYRTRMAMADGGELIILAPALRGFGEDPEIDKLIRRHGYFGTDHTLDAIEEDPVLAGNLSAAAHLIHGTSEGRFRVTYCPGDGVTRDEIESVGFAYRRYEDAAAEYDPLSLTTGHHTAADGRSFFYIANPALGLWAAKARLG